MPKRTGIVRRMDDLGRIVFPKELRRQLGLEEGAPLELGIGETEDGQKYLYAAPYKSSQDAFKEFADIALSLLRPNSFIAVFSVDKALMEIRQSGLTEAQCWGLAAGLHEVIHKPALNRDSEVLKLDGGWPLYIVTRSFVCNSTPAGHIMLGQASKDAACLSGLQTESRYMATLAGQVFETAGWM